MKYSLAKCNTHKRSLSAIRRHWSPVVVEDKVVIRANSTVVAGVRLNTGCVIAAGSVVTKDVPSGEVWAGNPAKFLMTLEQYESRGNQMSKNLYAIS